MKRGIVVNRPGWIEEKGVKSFGYKGWTLSVFSFDLKYLYVVSPDNKVSTTVDVDLYVDTGVLRVFGEYARAYECAGEAVLIPIPVLREIVAFYDEVSCNEVTDEQKPSS